MIRPQWLTTRRLIGCVLILVVILGLVGGGWYINYGGYTPSENDSDGYLKVQNFEDESRNITMELFDTQTNTRIFKTELTLGVDGRENYYGSDWPPMTAGEKRLKITVGNSRSNSYEFTSQDGDGPNLSIVISEDEIDFSLESSGMSVF